MKIPKYILFEHEKVKFAIKRKYKICWSLKSRNLG